MADVLKKVPVREQEPKVRATNFEDVCLGYNKEEEMENRFPSVNQSVLLLTTHQSTTLNQLAQRRQTDTKLL